MRNSCEYVVNMDRVKMFRYNTSDDGVKDDGDDTHSDCSLIC